MIRVSNGFASNIFNPSLLKVKTASIMTIYSASNVSKSEVDLTWVEFSEDEGEICTPKECNNEAVYKGYWKMSCTCWPTDVYYYCLTHVTDFIWRVGQDCNCIGCYAPIMLVKLEKIRGN